MKTNDFDAVARQAVQHVEQAVQRVTRNGSQPWQSADPNELLMLCADAGPAVVVVCTWLGRWRKVAATVRFWTKCFSGGIDSIR